MPGTAPTALQTSSDALSPRSDTIRQIVFQKMKINVMLYFFLLKLAVLCVKTPKFLLFLGAKTLVFFYFEACFFLKYMGTHNDYAWQVLPLVLQCIKT
jgi:hypothetical protein